MFRGIAAIYSMSILGLPRAHQLTGLRRGSLVIVKETQGIWYPLSHSGDYFGGVCRTGHAICKGVCEMEILAIVFLVLGFLSSATGIFANNLYILLLSGILYSGCVIVTKVGIAKTKRSGRNGR